MTVLQSFYPMDNKEGVNLNVVITSISATLDPSVPAPPHKVGDRVQGNGGSEWLFVKASATVTAYNFVAIDAGFNCANATEALTVSNQYVFGVAEFPPSQLGATVSIGNANGGVAGVGDYFWAALKIAAGGRINCAVTAARGAKLYVSGLIPGNLTSAATTTVPQITGVAIVEVLTTISVPQSAEFVQQSYFGTYVSV